MTTDSLAASAVSASPRHRTTPQDHRQHNQYTNINLRTQDVERDRDAVKHAALEASRLSIQERLDRAADLRRASYRVVAAASTMASPQADYLLSLAASYQRRAEIMIGGGA